jgi:transposase
VPTPAFTPAFMNQCVVVPRNCLPAKLWVAHEGLVGPSRSRARYPIHFRPYLYRARNLEQFFDNIKQCRRIATRYDKLAANYLDFIKLASI